MKRCLNSEEPIRIKRIDTRDALSYFQMEDFLKAYKNEPDDEENVIGVEDEYLIETETLEGESWNVKHAHERDNYVYMVTETHTYHVNGRIYPDSVTRIKSYFLPSFDANLCLNNLIFRGGQNRVTRANLELDLDWLSDGEDIVESGKFKGFQRYGILKKWKGAATDGTYIHWVIEMYYENLHGIPPQRLPASRRREILFHPEGEGGETIPIKHLHCVYQFLEWEKVFNQEGWVPYRQEWIIYDDDVVGTIDAVFYRDTDIPGEREYCIVDWKRTATSPKGVNIMALNQKYGYYPVYDLEASNLNGFTIQLNLYATILETRYNLKIKHMYILQLNPEKKSYTQYELPDIREKVAFILKVYRTYKVLKSQFETYTFTSSGLAPLETSILNSYPIIERGVTECMN